MAGGTEQPDNAPRPDDKTVIGNDATVVDGGGGSPGVSIPREIGPYKVKRPIGAGGMGTVVLAQQESPRRDVAIKIMNPGVVSRKALRRFEFEAQTLGKLQHPAIAQIYEAGTYDDGSGPQLATSVYGNPGGAYNTRPAISQRAPSTRPTPSRTIAL